MHNSGPGRSTMGNANKNTANFRTVFHLQLFLFHTQLHHLQHNLVVPVMVTARRAIRGNTRTRTLPCKIRRYDQIPTSLPMFVAFTDDYALAESTGFGGQVRRRPKCSLRTSSPRRADHAPLCGVFHFRSSDQTAVDTAGSVRQIESATRDHRRMFTKQRASAEQGTRQLSLVLLRLLSSTSKSLAQICRSILI